MQTSANAELAAENRHFRQNINLTAMKKVFLTLALMLTTMAASAQFYVGGGLSFTNTKVSGNDNTTFILSPEIGYKLDKSFAIGAILEYQSLEDKMTSYAISPYLRCTMIKKGNFTLFADCALEFGKIKPEGGESQSCWGVGIKPGIGYAISSHCSLAAHLGWIGVRDYDDMGDEAEVSLKGNDLKFSLYYNF